MKKAILKRPKIYHYIIEVFDFDKKLLLNNRTLQPFINKIINALGLKIVKKTFFNFKPYGVTLIYIISESHLTVHTWPERNYLHIDLFACAMKQPNKPIKQVIQSIFQTKNVRFKTLHYN